MGKLFLMMICCLSIGTLSAQEKLSKEEKARREKNVQAGNPFIKYGSKAPVATLSKGKYLEVHDLDSIVTIGTMRWNVEEKKIVGQIKIDSLNADAQPIGDVPGRWMSMDPLSEEFQSWSPYTMCFDNPIINIDPDGRAADDWRNSQGQLVYDPKANGGQGAYTKNATAQDRQFGDALRNSGERGTQRFNNLVNSKANIQVNFDSANYGGSSGLGYVFGLTDIGHEGDGYTTQKDGSVSLDKATITVFLSTCDTFVSDLKDGEVDLSGDSTYHQEDANTILNNNLTGFDMAVSTFGHEIDHTLPSNVQQQVNEKNNKPSKGLGSELTPQITGNTILKDIAKKK